VAQVARKGHGRSPRYPFDDLLDAGAAGVVLGRTPLFFPLNRDQSTTVRPPAGMPRPARNRAAAADIFMVSVSTRKDRVGLPHRPDPSTSPDRISTPGICTGVHDLEETIVDHKDG
jgi:hypothetical protein